MEALGFGSIPEAPGYLEADDEAASNRPKSRKANRRRSVLAAIDVIEQEFGRDALMEKEKEVNADVSQPSTKDTRAEAWMTAVQNCVLLNSLSAAELAFVLKTARPIDTVEGTTVFDEGDPTISGMLYLVGWGRYRAVAQTKRGGKRRLRDFGPQDNFGSNELLVNDGTGGRGFSVIVLEPGLIWGIPGRTVHGKLRIPPPLRIPGLAAFCATIKLFEGLSKERMQQLMRGAEKIELPPGEALCHEGEMAHSIYAVREGSVVTSQSGSDMQLTISPPSTLGESSLSADDELRVRGATVCASEEGATIIKWEVAAVEALIGFGLQEESLALQNRMLVGQVAFGGRPLAQGLSKDDVEALIDSMDEQSYDVKDIVATDREANSALYVIKSGEARVQKLEVKQERAPKKGTSAPMAKESVPKVVRTLPRQPSKSDLESGIKTAPSKKVTVTTLRRGDCFGELSLLDDNDPKHTMRKTTITASGTAPLVMLKLTPEVLSELGGLRTWRIQLVDHIRSAGVAGEDLVVLEKTGALPDSDPDPTTKKKSSTAKQARRRSIVDAVKKAASNALAGANDSSASGPAKPGLLKRMATRVSMAGNSASSSRASRASRASQWFGSRSSRASQSADDPF